MIGDHAFALKRLENALAPNAAPPIDPVARQLDSKGKEYWRSGHVTALTERACIAAAERSRASLGNVPKSLLAIPWC